MSELIVRGITVSFGGTNAVDDVSCQVEAGTVFGIIGPNGAGKSTLIRAISGLTRPDSGTVSLSGRDLSRLSFAVRCRAGLGLTFQTPLSDGELTVAEQIFGQCRAARHTLRERLRRSAVDPVDELLASMELQDVADRPTSTLTLGEIRRFELARAMANDPKVLLIDEPSSGMNAQEAQLLVASLRSVVAAGVAIVLIEHNIPFMRALAAHILVLDAGRILEEGPTESVLASAAVKEAYLGRSAA